MPNDERDDDYNLAMIHMKEVERASYNALSSVLSLKKSKGIDMCLLKSGPWCRADWSPCTFPTTALGQFSLAVTLLENHINLSPNDKSVFSKASLVITFMLQAHEDVRSLSQFLAVHIYCLRPRSHSQGQLLAGPSYLSVSKEAVWTVSQAVVCRKR